MERALARATDLPVTIANLWNPNRVGSALLPYLAWTMGVEIWPDDAALDPDPKVADQKKRALIREYLIIRSLRGTKAALERAYKLLGVSIDIITRPEGRPFRFKLVISGQPISSELRADILRLTDRLKSQRDLYDIEIDFKSEAGVGIYGLSRMTSVVRITGIAK
jgi:phage tail P2-like protein